MLKLLLRRHGGNRFGNVTNELLDGFLETLLELSLNGQLLLRVVGRLLLQLVVLDTRRIVDRTSGLADNNSSHIATLLGQFGCRGARHLLSLLLLLHIVVHVLREVVVVERGYERRLIGEKRVGVLGELRLQQRRRLAASRRLLDTSRWRRARRRRIVTIDDHHVRVFVVCLGRRRRRRRRMWIGCGRN